MDHTIKFVLKHLKDPFGNVEKVLFYSFKGSTIAYENYQRSLAPRQGGLDIPGLLMGCKVSIL